MGQSSHNDRLSLPSHLYLDVVNRKLFSLILCPILVTSMASTTHAESVQITQPETGISPYSRRDQEFSNFRLPATERDSSTMAEPEAGIDALADNLSLVPTTSYSEERSAPNFTNAINEQEGGDSPNPSISTAASANEPSGYKPPEWKDVRDFEIAFQVLNVVDAIETLSCLDRHRCYEMNPIMGSQPSTGRVIVVKAAAGLLHYAVTRYLLKKHPDWVDEWMITTTVAQGGVVLWNFQHCF